MLYVKTGILNKGLNQINSEKHRAINSVKNEYLTRKKNNYLIFIDDLAVTGEDIINYTKKRNREIGILKKELFKMCFFNNNFNNNEKLITFLKTI